MQTPTQLNMTRKKKKKKKKRRRRRRRIWIWIWIYEYEYEYEYMNMNINIWIWKWIWIYEYEYDYEYEYEYDMMMMMMMKKKRIMIHLRTFIQYIANPMQVVNTQSSFLCSSQARGKLHSPVTRYGILHDISVYTGQKEACQTMIITYNLWFNTGFLLGNEYLTTKAGGGGPPPNIFELPGYWLFVLMNSWVYIYI